MNSKIKELAIRATENFPNHIVTSDGKVVVEQFESRVNIETLATLVLQECLDAIYETELTMFQTGAIDPIVKNICAKFGNTQ